MIASHTSTTAGLPMTAPLMTVRLAARRMLVVPAAVSAVALLCALSGTPARAQTATVGTIRAVPNVVAPSPVTISVTYIPSTTLVATQSYQVNWSSTNASSVGFSCTASGTGYNASGTFGPSGSLSNTASSAWVGYPSTCVWTAYGTEDVGEVTKIVTTVAAPLVPLPSVSVVRTPSTMTAGQSYTLSWSTTDATSLSHTCLANGTGYTVNESLPVGGSTAGTASGAWVGYPSSCVWTASGPGGSKTVNETMTTAAAPVPAPTLSVARSPSTMTAEQAYTLTWSSTDATSLTHVCSAGGSGYTVNESLAVNGSSAGTASSAWVGFPSTCTWTATGAGGSKSVSETMTTVAAPVPLPTLSVTRNPSTMTAGQGYTLTWSSTNATSLTHACSAGGSGYTVNESLAVNSSTAGTASSAWVGFPSTCTWTATGAGGSKSVSETMTTVAAPVPLPTLSVTRSPSTMTAEQGYTLTWSSTNATSLTHVCSAGGSGYTVNESLAVNGSSSGTASSAWVGFPSTCTWTATGADGSKSVSETMTTLAAGVAAPTISVTRTPSPMISGQSFTLSWATSNTTSLTRACTATGTGYTVNDAPAANGGSVPGTALAGWVGYPSSCTWTATGPGGTKTFAETMTTNLPAPTITASRTPSPMVAGQPFTLNWSSTNATSVTRVCTSTGTGYTINDAPATSGTAPGTASSVWVNYPSTCTWNATGQGGSASFIETMTTNAAAATDVVTYIHTDGLGSPVARSDQAGATISTTGYEPYGLTAAGVTPTIGFTGHVNDSDTGLAYMQQRYYDPVAGRFLSIDPVTTDANSGSSFNRYNYANNNPYRYIDPDGRDAADKWGDVFKAEMSNPQGERFEAFQAPAIAVTGAMLVVPVVVAVGPTVAAAVVNVATSQKGKVAVLAILSGLSKAGMKGPNVPSLPARSVDATKKVLNQIKKESNVLPAKKPASPPPPPPEPALPTQ